jgi:hypothetical protein
MCFIPAVFAAMLPVAGVVTAGGGAVAVCGTGELFARAGTALASCVCAQAREPQINEDEAAARTAKGRNRRME